MLVKSKALGLVLVATLAMSALAARNAWATGTGHFIAHGLTAEKEIHIVGSEVAPHVTELTLESLEGAIICDVAIYTTTLGKNVATSTTIDAKPTYEKCHTTGQLAGTTLVVTNGCSYTFTPGGTGTVHLDCPLGKKIEVTDPNCKVTIGPQTLSAATYDNAVEGNSIITLTLNAQLKSEYHEGICVFLGTNRGGKLQGSVTVAGFNGSGGAQLDITHTSP